MELLCLDIMNSNRFGGYLAKPGRDMLGDEEWLRMLTDKWNLDAELPIEPHDLEILRELRGSMRQAVKYLNLDTQLCGRELARVNSILEHTPCQIKLVEDDGNFKVEKVPLCDGWHRVIWSAAYSFVTLLSEYEQTRIKICDNKDCGCIFYDESKSRTRRWCDQKTCGNMMKVRRYRSRQSDRSKQEC